MIMSTGITARATGGRYILGRFCLKAMSVPDSSEWKCVITDCGVSQP